MALLDGLTSIDELIAENTRTLEELKAILEREEERETKVVSFTYPDTGSDLATLQAGKTVLDFGNGTVTDVDGGVSRMGRSLQSEGLDWLRSFFVQSDKKIVIVTEDGSSVIATEERDGEGSQQQFKKLTLITTEETDVLVIVCTSPESVLHVVGNVAVLGDPKDVFGKRTYIGAGELAARIGSINTFERRGNVVSMDDFESSTLKWIATSSNGGSIARSNLYANFGSYSVIPTVPAGADSWTAMNRKFHKFVDGRWGLEWFANMVVSADPELMKIQGKVEWNDGTYNKIAAIEYNWSNNKLYYYDGSWHEIATKYVDYGTGYNAFIPFKFVFDTIKNKYTRLYIADSEYDLSEYDIYTAGSAASPELIASIISTTIVSVGKNYVDSIILTQNEPLI